MDYLLNIDGLQYEQIMHNEGDIPSLSSVDSEDPYTIIYTGGTTGEPKGVVLTHRSIFWNSINTVMSWQLSSTDVTLTYLPMFHTGGLNALSLPILHIGGTVIIGRDFEPASAIDLLNREKCTITLMVPTMYHMMIHTPRFRETSFPSMHT
ncbi:MAG: AMP-binding protein, partial [Bacilli bacterium]